MVCLDLRNGDSRSTGTETLNSTRRGLGPLLLLLLGAVSANACGGDEQRTELDAVGTAAALLTASEQAKLLANDGTDWDFFGHSVALDGNTTVVGAFFDDDNGEASGSAYAFTRAGSIWAEPTKLTAGDAAAGDNFGYSVAVDGDTALVGARLKDDNGEDSGAAYLFIRTGGSWSEQAKLTAGDGAVGDQFGFAVALAGDTALVGAGLDDDNGEDSGAAYVFIRTGGSWSEQAKLLANDGTDWDFFGHSVALAGDTALVGAPGDDDNGWTSGAAYVFIRTGSVWSEQAKLLPSDGAKGDYFGQAVTVDGDTAIAGAPNDDDNGWTSGAAYVFIRTGIVWTEQAKLLPSDGSAHDWFGLSISLDGRTAVVGAPRDGDNGWNSGSAYVFTQNGGSWSEQAKLLPSDGAVQNHFGISAAVSCDTAVAGAPYDSDMGDLSGSAYVFLLKKDDGEPCTKSCECNSTYCVDGFCCDSACGGGVTNDCYACSIAAGATTNGVCDPLTGDPCDDGVFCNGTETCADGVCGASTGDPCPGPDGDADCIESCNENADSCSGNDPDGTPCPDGTCLAGICKGTGGTGGSAAQGGSGGSTGGTGGSAGQGGSGGSTGGGTDKGGEAATGGKAGAGTGGTAGGGAAGATGSNEATGGLGGNQVEQDYLYGRGCACRQPSRPSPLPAWAALGLISMALIFAGRSRLR